MAFYPEFREKKKTYKQGSKTAIGKTIPPTRGSITVHSLAQD
jgi:hypothetical protein